MKKKKNAGQNVQTELPEINGIPVHCAHDAIVPLEKIIGNPRNPNSHPESQVFLLAKIIKGQGWRAPITVSVRSGFIVRGHCRFAAAQKLGLSAVPVDYQDYENEATEWADLIADNRVAELAEMDTTRLRDLLIELDTGAVDMEYTGFDAAALEELMTAAPPPGSNKGKATSTSEYKPKYSIIIDCENESAQTEMLERFIEEGLECRALML